METIDDVTGDAREGFCFSREKRPQERARAVGASGGASPGHEAALLAIEGIARDALDGMQGGVTRGA